MAKQKKHPTGTIAQNKKARHDYFIEHRFEAGLVLALIKCEIALGKGKKEYDKRHTERERDSDRELQRAVRNKGKED